MKKYFVAVMASIFMVSGAFAQSLDQKVAEINQSKSDIAKIQKQIEVAQLRHDGTLNFIMPVGVGIALVTVLAGIQHVSVAGMSTEAAGSMLGGLGFGAVVVGGGSYFVHLESQQIESLGQKLKAAQLHLTQIRNSMNDLK